MSKPFAKSRTTGGAPFLGAAFLLASVLTCALFLVSLFTLGGCSNPAPLNNSCVRTNGYYYWDNGIDTIADASPDKKARLLRVLRRADTSFHEFRDDPTDCIPAGVIPTEGSSLTHLLTFYSNRSGLAFYEACRGNTVIQRNVSLFKQAATRDAAQVPGVIPQQHIVHSLDIDSFNRISFCLGSTDQTREVFTGFCFPDSLVLIHNRPSAQPTEPDILDKRVYKFYTFDQLPAGI